ncbi:hypothetical protein EIMP300_90650 [Escherichia coli]|uniref:Uncharacterized protein n=1 Tax=Escherichia coli TaxID=562 RepID=A0A8S0G340_ECOLX|nr:hypothetical protein EIMP300_90650 [Escherichia coli]
MHQPHNLVDITRAGDPNVRRLLAVHSLPWRGMNRRLIVQFDPDEPSMSAPARSGAGLKKNPIPGSRMSGSAFDPAPSQGGNPRLEEPHNLVERVFGSKVTGAGGDAIPLR